jgi:glutamate synthase (NADPH/NADH) large chain
MVFLPRTDLGAQERCRTSSRARSCASATTIYGWRQVPVNIGHRREGQRHPARDRADHDRERAAGPIGGPVRARPLHHPPPHREAGDRRPDQELLHLLAVGRSIIYKGMFLAEQLDAFYPDLLDERFVSSFAIYPPALLDQHLPDLALAQPFRMLAHNGEINTLRATSTG